MELNKEDKDSIKHYFDLDEWYDLSIIEKTRYFNLKRNYETIKSMGLNPQIPKFMAPRQKVNQDILKPDVEGKVSIKENMQVKEEKKTESSEPDSKSRIVKLSPKHNKIATNLLNIAEKYLIYLEKLLEDDVEELISATDYQTTSEVSRRYPKRNIEKKSYFEEEVLSEDEYLYCDDCGRSYEGDCPVHGAMLFIRDNKVKPGVGNDRARNSCPPFLSVCKSGFKHAGFGIWTELQMPKGVVFGPYKGTIIRDHKEAQMSGYAWQIRRGGRTHHYIEGSDTSKSNWMRYVNCADCEERQNLIAFQLKGKIYYRTYKEVKAYTELLVWYGVEYARDLGIDLLEKKEEKQSVSFGGYECYVCRLLLSSEEYLALHRKTHPHRGNDRKHRCPFCPFSTSWKGSLQIHLRIHTKERPFRCEQCGRAFTVSSHLRQHLLAVHSGERPFRCERCGKRFNDPSHLRKHQRAHDGIRPFVCSTCGKRFSNKSNLGRHELIHTGQRPHKCSQCGYRAAQLSGLRYHVITVHTKEYTHVCRDCGKGFVQASELRKHVEIKHKGRSCGKDE